MTWSKRMGKKRLILFAAGGVLVVALVAAAVVFGLSWWRSSHQEPGHQEPEIVRLTHEIQSYDASSTEGRTELMDTHTSRFEAVRSELEPKDPSKWTKGDVDNAYYVLEYSSKAELYWYVDIMLDKLDAAAATGIDIDDNAFGFSDEYRQDLRKWVDSRFDQPVEEADVTVDSVSDGGEGE